MPSIQKPVEEDTPDSWFPGFYKVQDLSRLTTKKFAKSKAAKSWCNFSLDTCKSTCSALVRKRDILKH